MRRVLLAFVSAATLAVAQPASADTVTDWWAFASDLAAPLQAMPHPPEQDRAVTRAALAMFEAVNAIDRRYESFLNVSAADASASQEAAAATAAYRVLLQHFPANKAAIEDSYAITMAQIADGPAKDAGKAIGEKAAEAANAAGGIDAAIVQTPYRPRTKPGEWIGTALPQIEPYMMAFRPWVIESADALRPPPPPALTSETWARDLEEVRRLGGKTSSERTPHQTIMARYRQAFDIKPTMRAIADGEGRSPVQNARMLARYQLAFDDAALAMIAAKFHYNYWRPITAIRNGEADGNDATQLDPAWTPLLTTPGFPEYPCGHCAVAAAVGEIMETETGVAPEGGVRVGSQAIPLSVIQVLPSWDRWTQEVSDSRIYGGVHYRFSNDAGEEIGRKAARAVADQVMKPLPRGGPPLMEPGVLLHIGAGGVAIVAGYAALAFRKGARGHRLAGSTFVVAMLLMAGMATVLGALNGQVGNVVAGSLACYLVWSGRVALRNGRLTGTRRIRAHIWRMCTALFIATGSFFLGQQDELPAAVRGGWLFIPALTPLAALAFWMARTRGPGRRLKAASA